MPLLSLLPFAVFLILLLVAKKSLLFTAFVSLLITWIIAHLFWQINLNYAFLSLIKGSLVALDIFLIITGALFFLQVVQKAGVIDNLTTYLRRVNPDYRVQVLLLAWFFEAFMEGTAGFGTPGAVVVPLLVGIGLSPLQAVIVGLLGDNTPGVFGAAGTPLKVGFGSMYQPGIATITADLSMLGLVFPIIILWVVTRLRGKEKTDFWPVLPFGIICGLSLAIASRLSLIFGQEFPSILGPLLGIIPILLLSKKGWLLPKTPVILVDHPKTSHSIPLGKTVFPYLLLISLMVVGKLLIGGRGITLTFGLSHRFSFYHPGLIFVLTALAIGLMYRSGISLVKDFLFSVKKALLPFGVIALTSAIVQLMVNSGVNAGGLPSMVNTLAASLKPETIPFLTPFIGAFGSMVTGSITVSNLMFGEVIKTASINAGYNHLAVLALLAVGASAGDTIALADILAAEAVVNLKNREREVVGRLIVPCLLFLALLGFVGMIIIH